MAREALAKKLLLLGMDGMDPRFTNRMLKKGKMPNVQKLLDKGAASKDLIMLGGHPTITPPMWTTLACGCNCNVHGITQFSRKGKTIDTLGYNLDSRLCLAEPLWNVFAEAGKKTLVWHWPGSSWPPTSDSENLFVVDGSSPGGVGMGTNKCDEAALVGASVDIPAVKFQARAASDAKAACVVEDVNLDGAAEFSGSPGEDGSVMLILRQSQKTGQFTDVPPDAVKSPIKDAEGWANAPADAKEFTVLFSGGLIRRPGLILKGEDGKYSRVQIFKNKKETEPFADLQGIGKMYGGIIDEAVKADGTRVPASRAMEIISLAEDGTELVMYYSMAMDISNDSTWHPKRLFHDVLENVGPIAPSTMVGCQSADLIKCMLDDWYVNADWQAEAMQYVMAQEDIEVVFSHFHAIDLQTHMFLKHMNEKTYNKRPVEDVIDECEAVYVQADHYIGKFLHYLDEGWTIVVFSDHGLVSAEYEQPFLGDTNGVNYRLMHDWGFTNAILDENGNETNEIDWSTTKAVALGECHIWLNLKGREPFGIVEPEDQYEVEREIIDALYNYRDPETGRRIVSVAVRNRDAVHFGLGGPLSGDIIYFNEEGFNFDHGDMLSTAYGAVDTSASPIFFAAGPGVKENFITDRIIREADFAATVAALGGVRMPAQCEGAPAYQIMTEEF